MNRLNRLLKNFNSLSIPGFTDGRPLPQKTGKKAALLVFMKRRGMVLVLALLLVAAIAAFTLIKPNKKVNDLYPGITPSPTTRPMSSPESLEASPSPTPKSSVKPTVKPSPVASPTNAPSPSPTATTSPSPTPTTAPSPVPSPTIAPAPSPSPEPPVINISYPTEGQIIHFSTNDQQLCLVDTPVSGTYGAPLERRLSLDNSKWSDYKEVYTFCYTPSNGTHSIQAQYKNKYNLESAVYNIHFTVYRPTVD